MVCAKAIESERLIHKNSSGADCYISTFGGLMYYIKNKGFNKIESRKDLSLIVVKYRNQTFYWSFSFFSQEIQRRECIIV